MSDVMWVFPCTKYLPRRKLLDSSSGVVGFFNHFSTSEIRTASLVGNSLDFLRKIHVIRVRITTPSALSVEDSLQDIDLPVSIKLEPIVSEGQFDRIINEAQQLEESKMSTLQLWKDSKKQAEVIGGHKAYLVVNEVRETIEECFV